MSANRFATSDELREGKFQPSQDSLERFNVRVSSCSFESAERRIANAALFRGVPQRQTVLFPFGLDSLSEKAAV